MSSFKFAVSSYSQVVLDQAFCRAVNSATCNSQTSSQHHCWIICHEAWWELIPSSRFQIQHLVVGCEKEEQRLFQTHLGVQSFSPTCTTVTWNNVPHQTGKALKWNRCRTDRVFILFFFHKIWCLLFKRMFNVFPYFLSNLLNYLVFRNSHLERYECWTFHCKTFYAIKYQPLWPCSIKELAFACPTWGQPWCTLSNTQWSGQIVSSVIGLYIDFFELIN